MSIKTQKLVVAPLRGMDQRWDARPNHASHIENMSWSDRDSWTTSSGYRRLVENRIEKDDKEQKSTNIYDTASPPASLFWFSQHGNKLQWLIYEDQDGAFRYFNGSYAGQTVGPNHAILHADGNFFDGTEPSTTTTGTTVTNTGHTRFVDGNVSHTAYCLYGSNLYLVNGTDAPLVYDGKKITRAGFSGRPAQPSATTTEKSGIRLDLNLGVGYGGSDNDFKYIVTFVNERGQESQMSESSARISFNTNTDFTAVDSKGGNASTAKLAKKEYIHVVAVEIPTGPVGTVARRIYRTQNMVDFSTSIEEPSSGSPVPTLLTRFREAQFGQEHYFLEEIPDNVTTLFVDTLSDLDLGSLTLPEDLGDFPRNSKMIAVFKNTLFVAGDMTEELRYSRPLNPEVFPKNNVFNLSDAQTSLITGMYPTGDSLVVFKHRAIYLIKGDPANGFFAQTLTTDVGCIAHQTIRDVPGLGLVFLAGDGIYVLEGTYQSGQKSSFFKLSQQIRDVFDRVNIEYADEFRSVVYHRDREYWLTVALDDKTTPDTVLKFSYEIGAWSVYTSSEVCGMIEVQDYRGYLYLAGPNSDSSVASRGLYVYGGTNSLGELGTIASVYETVNIPFNSVYDNFSPARVQTRVASLGNQITLEVFVNREPATVATSASATQIRPLEDANFPLYGTAKLDGLSVYKEHRPVNVRLDFSTMHKGPVNELKLRFTCDQEMELINYELEGRLGSSRDVINLTEKFGGSIKR